MEIAEWLKKNENGVLADANSGVVRLWIAPISDGRTQRAVKRFFPYAEFREATRLGGWRKLTEAIKPLAEMRMRTSSPQLQALHLVEGRDGAGMQTIPDSQIR